MSKCSNICSKSLLALSSLLKTAPGIFFGYIKRVTNYICVYIQTILIFIIPILKVMSCFRFLDLVERSNVYRLN